MQEQLQLTYSNQITAVLIFDLYTSVFALPTDILYYNYMKLIWTNTTIIYSYTVQYKTCIAYIRRCESKQISKISLKCSKWKMSLKWWNTNTRCPATHVETRLCWEPRTSVLNMTLTAIQLQPQLGRLQLLIDICCSRPGCGKRHVDRRDRQTYGRTPDRYINHAAHTTWAAYHKQSIRCDSKIFVSELYTQHRNE